MRLKIATTAALVFGILAIARVMVLQATVPFGADKGVFTRHIVELMTTFAVAGVSLVLAAIGAILLMRAARRRYLEQVKSNLRELVEGSLEDHARKR